MGWFIKTINEGGTAPKFYGVAWRTFNRPYLVYCAPLPFNHVIRTSRHLWHRFRYPMYFGSATVLLERYDHLREHYRALVKTDVELKARIAFLEKELYG